MEILDRRVIQIAIDRSQHSAPHLATLRPKFLYASLPSWKGYTRSIHTYRDSHIHPHTHTHAANSHTSSCVTKVCLLYLYKKRNEGKHSHSNSSSGSTQQRGTGTTTDSFFRVFFYFHTSTTLLHLACSNSFFRSPCANYALYLFLPLSLSLSATGTRDRMVFDVEKWL